LTGRGAGSYGGSVPYDALVITDSLVDRTPYSLCGPHAADFDAAHEANAHAHTYIYIYTYFTHLHAHLLVKFIILYMKIAS